MSFDPPADNAAWAEDDGFQYELWTDDDKILALTYGAADSASDSLAGRVTVILDEDCNLVLEYLDGVNVSTHPAQVLDDVGILFGR